MSRKRKSGCLGVVFKLFVLLVLAAAAAGFWLWQRYDGFANAPMSGIEPGEALVVANDGSISRKPLV